jgi:hypothetical protein
MLLLNDAEWRAYRTGQTVFSFNSSVMQVEAEKYPPPRVGKMKEQSR